MKKLTALPAVIVLLLLFTSCQKELNKTALSEKNCKITRGDYYYSSAGIYDSVFFTYDANGRVTKAEGDLYLATYAYTGENISSRQFFDKYNSNLLLTNDTVSYDNDNRITKIITWYFPNPLNSDPSRKVYVFSYANGRIDKVTETDTNFPATGPEEENYVSSFTTDATGNIETVITKAENGNLVDSIHYSYNADPNYFKEIHPHFFLFDPFFRLHPGFSLVADLPYSYSNNNVDKFSYDFTGEDIMSYELDSLNNPTGIDMGGAPQMKYFYQCN